MDRYKPKRDNSMPEWVEQYKAVIALGLGALVLVVGVLLYDMRPAPPPVGPAPTADLVIVMGPVKTWEEGSTTRLKGVQLKIKNRGLGFADGIRVAGVFRGVPLALSGKPSLAPGEIGDYSVTFSMVVLNSDPMEFQAECATCIPFVAPNN